MLEIAGELAIEDPAYAEMATKFIEHFLWIASSMTRMGGHTGMWDEEDGFFYDMLRLPNGEAHRLKVRSMVGLIPLCAATVFESWRDLVLFYEYFHGDNGAGLGASHQTGWTGIIARTMHLFATSTPQQVLEIGKRAPFAERQAERELQHT